MKDLLPIKGMQLNVLDVSATQVSDLTPLAGMPLNNLHLGGTRVADLSSLAGAPLAILQCECVRVTDASLAPVAGFKSLRKLSLQGAKVTAAGIATLQKALPECKVEWDDPAKASKLAYLAPSFQQWVAATQKLSAEKQLEAVSKKLMELNPGFDGKLTGIELRPEPKIENEVVVELGLIGVEIIDLSPVRVLTGLKKLGCWGVGAQRAKFADLSPLTGLKLDYLAITGSDASDLTPLQGMPLATLHCAGSRVEDLTPLRGAPLTRLLCKSTRVTDLTPLAGMPLKTFECNGLVADIAPLAGMPLESLSIEQTQATELTPLETCQSLKSLKVSAQRITVEQTAALQKVLPNCKIERIEPKPIAEPAK